jgi:hypothetical protein
MYPTLPEHMTTNCRHFVWFVVYFMMRLFMDQQILGKYILYSGGSPVGKFLHVTLLAHTILRWILDFWKIVCAPGFLCQQDMNEYEVLVK